MSSHVHLYSRWVDIVRNGDLSSSSLIQFKSLKQLDLSNAKLSTFEWSILTYSSIESLILDNNALGSLNLDLLSSSLPLRSLSVRRCSLTDLHGICIFSQLSNLNADHNHISNTGIPSSPCQSIRSLSLQHNRLASLVEILTTFPSATVLHLSDNAISDLSLLSLPSTSPLEELHLANNLIHSPQKPLSAPNLRILNLDGNRISSICKLSKLSGLSVLILSRNALEFVRLGQSKTNQKTDDYLLISEGGLFPHLIDLNLNNNEALESLSGLDVICPQLEKLEAQNCGLNNIIDVLSNVLELSMLKELSFLKNPFSFGFHHEERTFSMYRAILISYLPGLVTLDGGLLYPKDKEWAHQYKHDIFNKREGSLEPTVRDLKSKFLKRASPPIPKKTFASTHTSKYTYTEPSPSFSTRKKSLRSTQRRRTNKKTQPRSFDSKLAAFLSPSRRSPSFTEQLALTRYVVSPSLRSVLVDYITEHHRVTYGYGSPGLSHSSANVERVIPREPTSSYRRFPEYQTPAPTSNTDYFDVHMSAIPSSHSLQDGGRRFFSQRPTRQPSHFERVIRTAKESVDPSSMQQPFRVEPGRKFPFPAQYSSHVDHTTTETWDLLPIQRDSGALSSFIQPFTSTIDGEDQSQTFSNLRMSIVNNSFLSMDPLISESNEIVLKELSSSNSEFIELANYLKLFDVELLSCTKVFDNDQYKRIMSTKKRAKRFLGFPLLPASDTSRLVDHTLPSSPCVLSSAPPLFCGRDRLLVGVVLTLSPQLCRWDGEVDFESLMECDKDSLVMYVNMEERVIDRVYVRNCRESVFISYLIEVGNIGEM
ncbi:hypothetical protein P9112_000858 [Eukaryota sp. TZLM1-RC]